MTVRARRKIGATAAVLVAGTAASILTTEPASANSCVTNAVCFYENTDYTGREWDWYPTSGYRDMPSFLHDHAYSVKSNACAYVFDFHSGGKYDYWLLKIGSTSRNWDVGRKIDAVNTRPCP